jgi:glycosyltransferase involved in cell wall biosynthesis
VDRSADAPMAGGTSLVRVNTLDDRTAANQRPEGPVSVVIPTYRGRESIVKVVTPVLDDPATGEVVVVVDGSRDGTLELLQEWSRREPRIRAIFQENAGDAAARQRGIEAATLDVVVLLDDDVIASPGLIGSHARHHMVEKRQVVLGYMPTQLPQPRGPGHAATVIYAEGYESMCNRYEADAHSILRNFWMGNVSMRRNCALEVGLATGLSIRRHSDMDFGFRCREAGIDAIFDRSLLARHCYQKNLRQFAAQCRRSGDARAKLMYAYGPLAQDLDPFRFTSRWRRAIVRTLSSAWVHPVGGRLAMALTFVAGRMGAGHIEMRSAVVLQGIETHYGFERARRS